MTTFTVLIREVVTTDRRVTIEADSRDAAWFRAVNLAAHKPYKPRGEVAAVSVSAFPLPKTLEPTDV